MVLQCVLFIIYYKRFNVSTFGNFTVGQPGLAIYTSTFAISSVTMGRLCFESIASAIVRKLP